jgi:ABC-type methionine transport system permease subunit
MDSLLLGVTVTMISLISTLQGYFGVGKLGNSIIKDVDRAILIETEI